MKTESRISIKSDSELEILKEAGQILTGILKEVACSLKSGMTTQDIDIFAENLIRDNRVVPAFKGYRGFPGCLCISVNEEIVHGIPGDRIVQNGDIVSIDCGIIYKDWYSDTALTVAVGDIKSDLQNLLDVTKESLYKGIEQARVGNRLSDISHAIQKHVEMNKLSIVKEFVGHGIGKNLHEDPEIPNYGSPNQGPELKEGMVFAIEPMVNLGASHTEILEDGWTVVTRDRMPSAHFEHSIAITKDEPVIFTE